MSGSIQATSPCNRFALVDDAGHRSTSSHRRSCRCCPPHFHFRPCSYLALQDVPRTNDRAPSRTFYTWRANADTTIARLTSDLYRAAGNLHARLEHEARKQSELWELLELPVAPSIIERRQGEIAALKAVTSRLEAALLDLDWQVCIFADV